MSDKQQLVITGAVTPGVDSPLSPRRAFVVQFRTGMGGMQELFAGRVEHITSGRATRFRSPSELVAFLEQVLSDVEEKPP